MKRPVRRSVKLGRSRLLAAACLAGLLGACAGEEGPASTARQPVAAPVSGKPLAAVGLDYAIEGEPIIGMPLTVRITLRPPLPLTDVTVDVEADEGLYVDPATSSFTAAHVAADAPAEWSAAIVPLREGRFLVRIVVQGVSGGRPLARSVVAPVRVGAAAAVEPLRRDKAATSPASTRR